MHKAIDKYFKLIVIVVLVYIAAMLSIHVTDSPKSVSSVKTESRHGREDVAVYVSQSKSQTYHSDEYCKFLAGRAECLSESDATKKGYKPCAACTTDQSSALAEGWHVGSTFDEFSELLGF